MNVIKFVIATILTVAINASCTSQTEKKEDSNKTSKVEQVDVYYFHYTRRCATCNAVENVSKEAIKELYGDKVTFSSYNLDEEKGEEKGKELEVSGQTLLIVAGDQKINITNEGFMNARTNPEQLKQIIKEKIDVFL